MTLDSLIMFAGAFVATLPFLGFPNSWDAAFFVIAGVFVIALGIVVRRREKSSPVLGDGGRYTETVTSRPELNQHGQS